MEKKNKRPKIDLNLYFFKKKRTAFLKKIIIIKFNHYITQFKFHMLQK